MNKRFRGLIMLMFFTGLYFSLPALAYPQTSLKDLFSGGTSELLQIDAPFEFDNKNKVMICAFPEGSSKLVHVTYGDLTIDCKRIEIYYKDKAEKDSGNKEQTDKISRIVIKGGVKIIQADGSSASADNIVYTKSDEKVVMTGNPAVISGDGYKMEGPRVIYDLNNDRIFSEDADTGTSTTTIYPDKLKGKPSAP
jgi:lipopolysaccharide transport protein LptA